MIHTYIVQDTLAPEHWENFDGSTVEKLTEMGILAHYQTTKMEKFTVHYYIKAD